jgi:hypothetical protein
VVGAFLEKVDNAVNLGMTPISRREKTDKIKKYENQMFDTLTSCLCLVTPDFQGFFGSIGPALTEN